MGDGVVVGGTGFGGSIESGRSVSEINSPTETISNVVQIRRNLESVLIPTNPFDHRYQVNDRSNVVSYLDFARELFTSIKATIGKNDQLSSMAQGIEKTLPIFGRTDELNLSYSNAQTFLARRFIESWGPSEQEALLERLFMPTPQIADVKANIDDDDISIAIKGLDTPTAKNMTISGDRLDIASFLLKDLDFNLSVSKHQLLLDSPIRRHGPGLRLNDFKGNLALRYPMTINHIEKGSEVTLEEPNNMLGYIHEINSISGTFITKDSNDEVEIGVVQSGSIYLQGSENFIFKANLSDAKDSIEVDGNEAGCNINELKGCGEVTAMNGAEIQVYQAEGDLKFKVDGGLIKIHKLETTFTNYFELNNGIIMINQYLLPSGGGLYFYTLDSIETEAKIQYSYPAKLSNIILCHTDESGLSVVFDQRIHDTNDQYLNATKSNILVTRYEPLRTLRNLGAMRASDGFHIRRKGYKYLLQAGRFGRPRAISDTLEGALSYQKLFSQFRIS